MSLKPTTLKSKRCQQGERRLRAFALRFPEVREDHPWGHSAFKVKGKTFLFMALDGGDLSLSVKLPESGNFALMQPYASPTEYGLGKSGWVTARFSSIEKPPVPLLERWIDESYRAIAPKKLLAGLHERSLKGSLASRIRRKPRAGLEAVQERAWRLAAREKDRGGRT